MLMYCYPLKLSIPHGAVKKLHCMQNRAAKTVNPKAKITSWDIIEKIRNTSVAIDVFKSSHNLLLEDLNGYFKRGEHEIYTIGNGFCVVLPKTRSETGKNRLLTREPTFSTDSKKQRVMK